MDECPCGSNFPYTDCCAPIIRGATVADTAEDLLRSRYTAFAKKKWNYIRETTLPERNNERSTGDFLETLENVKWKKLEIHDIKSGNREDSEGEVTFVAYYEEDGKEKTLCERSKFLKRNGRWYYNEKQSKRLAAKPAAVEHTKPFTRSLPKQSRNDPCGCGSGKKFKKCCGK